MSEVAGLGAHLAPDTINRLLSAACQRFASALVLADNGRRLASLYLYGYVAEQCLAAAYFRSVGHPPNAPIDADTRKRRMFLARQLGVMSNESHPLVGWAKYLQHQRFLVGGLQPVDVERSHEAIRRAEAIHRYWRPELRYKVVEVGVGTLGRVQDAAKWILDNRMRL